MARQSQEKPGEIPLVMSSVMSTPPTCDPLMPTDGARFRVELQQVATAGLPSPAPGQKESEATGRSRSRPP